MPIRSDRLLAAAIWWQCLLAVLAAGCGFDSTPPAQLANGGSKSQPASKPATSGAAAVAPTSAEGILLAMAQAYQQAKAYRDEAIVRVSYRMGGQNFDDTAPLSVAYTAPNRLRLEAYRAVVASDGETIRARIEDESTGNIDNQFVARPAPPKLHLQDIYGDAMLSQVIGSGLARYPVQLELLLDEAPLASALNREAVRRTLAPASLEGRLCDRIAVASPDGEFVFWIDQQNRLLRRLEYPTGQLQPDVPVESDVQDLRLVVEFRNAQFASAASDETFALEAPDNSRQVRYFVVPPQPLPTMHFNKQPGEFSLTTLAGETVSSSSLIGKTAVLLWFNNHPAGQASLSALNRVAAQFEGNDAFAFHGICTEPSKLSDVEIQNLMRTWRIELPIARDLAAIGRDVFQVPVWPTLIVLDPQGRVQLFEPGHIDAVYEALPEVLPKIAAGENLAEQILASHQTQLDDYARALAVASGTGEAELIEIPTAQIAPRSEPNTLALREVWKCAEVAAPGNMLFLPGESANDSRLIVLSDSRNAVELDLNGEIVAQHALPLPDAAAVQHLATAPDGQGGRYYLAWANLGRQLFVLDDQWKLIGSYPDPDQPHDGIRDCTLGDLRGEGELTAYVAFWGAAGVHGVSLNGQRQWTNRAVASPIGLTVGPVNAADRRQLLISTAAGNLQPLNSFGREEAVRTIGRHAVHDLARSSLETMATPYCAFSFNAHGGTRAIAVDADFVERWSYELPAGAHRNAVRPVASGQVLPESEGDWILAAADGSVHVIAADGSASDYFYWGREITGIAAAHGESKLLFLATAEGVTAVELAAP